MDHINVKIFGKVQGVGFRFSARAKAKELDIKGFVRNEANGTVYAEIEGERKKLRQFIDWCQNDFGFAKVEKIESEQGKMKNFQEFSIE